MRRFVFASLIVACRFRPVSANLVPLANYPAGCGPTIGADHSATAIFNSPNACSGAPVQMAMYSQIIYSPTAQTAQVISSDDDTTLIVLNGNYVLTTFCCEQNTAATVSLIQGDNYLDVFAVNQGGPGYVAWSVLNAAGGVLANSGGVGTPVINGLHNSVDFPNGGFESCTDTQGAGWGYGGPVGGDPIASCPSWQLSGGAGYSKVNARYTGFNTPQGPFEGSAFGYLQGVSTMSNSNLGLIIGATYYITFLASTRPCCEAGVPGANSVNDLGVLNGGPPSAGLQYTGNKIFYEASITGGPSPAYTWTPYMSNQFIATGNYITFYTTNPRGGDSTTLIDLVMINLLYCPDTIATWYSSADPPSNGCALGGNCNNAGPGQYYIYGQARGAANSCPVVQCSFSVLGVGQYFIGSTNSACNTGITACTNGPANSQYTSSGGASNACAWSCKPGFQQVGNICNNPPPPPSPPPPPPFAAQFPTPYALYSDTATSPNGAYVLSPGVVWTGSGYQITTQTPIASRWISLNRVFSTNPCPGSQGFSYNFKMALSAVSSPNSIADGVSICFLNSAVTSSSSGSLPLTWGLVGHASFTAPGVCVGVDTWDNAGQSTASFAQGNGIGYRVWQTTAASAFANLIGSVYTIGTSDAILSPIATGSFVEHQIDYLNGVLTWRAGAQVLIPGAQVASIFPSTFFIAFGSVCGGVCTTVDLGANSLTCTAYPSPPPPSPPPPSPPPSPPPPSPPWAVISGAAPTAACYDVSSSYVGVDFPVQPFLPQTRAVPVGYQPITLMDRGPSGANGVLSGATYFFNTGELSFAGDAFATLPSVTLGMPTRTTTGLVQNGFSLVVTAVAPSPLPTSAATVLSLGNNLAGTSGATLRLVLTGTNYELEYGFLPTLSTFPWTSTNGQALPTVTAGSTARLLVRCSPNLVFCSLGNY